MAGTARGTTPAPGAVWRCFFLWIGARARVVGLVPLKSDSEALEALSGENVLRLHGERVMVHAVPQKGARILPRGRGWLELLPLLWVVCPMRGEQEAPAPLGAWRGRIIHHQSPPPRCAWAQGAAPLAAGPLAAGRAQILPEEAGRAPVCATRSSLCATQAARAEGAPRRRPTQRSARGALCGAQDSAGGIRMNPRAKRASMEASGRSSPCASFHRCERLVRLLCLANWRSKTL